MVDFACIYYSIWMFIYIYIYIVRRVSVDFAPFNKCDTR